MELRKIETPQVFGLQPHHKLVNNLLIGPLLTEAPISQKVNYMAVRIATGSEVIRKRTFINNDGTTTTPEERFSSSKAHLGKNRIHSQIKRGEDSTTKKEGA